MKNEVGLGNHNIAVLTGGISGANSPGGTENAPESAFKCAAVDVIAIHGYYSSNDDATAGTPWVSFPTLSQQLSNNSRQIYYSPEILLREEP